MTAIVCWSSLCCQAQHWPGHKPVRQNEDWLHRRRRRCRRRCPVVNMSVFGRNADHHRWSIRT